MFHRDQRRRELRTSLIDSNLWNLHRGQRIHCSYNFRRNKEKMSQLTMSFLIRRESLMQISLHDYAVALHLCGAMRASNAAGSAYSFLLKKLLNALETSYCEDGVSEGFACSADVVDVAATRIRPFGIRQSSHWSQPCRKLGDQCREICMASSDRIRLQTDSEWVSALRCLNNLHVIQNKASIRYQILLLRMAFNTESSHLDRKMKVDEQAVDCDIRTAAVDEDAHSVFNLLQKRLIVLTASTAALLSPLSSNIYLPALNLIASDLRVTGSLINLTVTSYLVCVTNTG